MFSKKITSMLLASSMIVAMQAGPVYAGDMASDINFLKYTSEAGTESGVELFENFEEKLESDDAELEEGRIAADAAADAAEAAAGTARGYADETESSDVEDAAENAALDAENARAAADLAWDADDSRTVAMAAEIAKAAQAEAEEALADAAEAKNFTLTAYCNCARCCGTAGNATASGVMPTSNHTVAMGGIEFGTKLLINGTVYTVEDRGTPYGHVDIFMDSHSEALQFGMGSADVYLIRE